MTQLILISGWAHPAKLLPPLQVRLEVFARARSCDAHDATAVLDASTGASIDVVGWSLGALRALEYASRHPDAVRRLVLVSGTARFCADAGYACGQDAALVRAMRGRLRNERDSVLTDFYRQCASPATIDATSLAQRLAFSQDLDRQTLAAGLDDLLRLDLREGASACKARVLLLHGAKDVVVPVDAARWLAKHLPSARLEIHPSCGHDLPLRDPDWVAKQIGAFLQST